MTGAQKPREEDTAVSVLKEKRTTSKAEYVNTANQIYVKTVDFLSRLSARYSRLIAADTAHLAGQVMDRAEQANKIFPSDTQRKELRKAHHLEALAALHGTPYFACSLPESERDFAQTILNAR